MATNLNPFSRKKWRGLGYDTEITESMNRVPGGLVRKSDLFGFVDMLAVPQAGGAWIYIQITSWGNISARLKKIRTEKTGYGQFAIPIASFARRILERGDKILVEGWKKDGHRYVAKERWITLEDLG